MGEITGSEVSPHQLALCQLAEFAVADKGKAGAVIESCQSYGLRWEAPVLSGVAWGDCLVLSWPAAVRLLCSV